MVIDIEHKPLDEMSIEELTALKQARYSSASNLIKEAWLVAERLGETKEGKSSWSAEGIGIFADGFGNYLTIHDGQKLVVSTAYRFAIPGRWEDIVRKYFAEAKLSEERRQQAIEQKKREQLLEQLI